MAYRPREVAQLLGVGRSTVFDWVRMRTVETVRIGGVVLIPASAVQDLLLRHRVAARPQASRSSASRPLGAPQARPEGGGGHGQEAPGFPGVG